MADWVPKIENLKGPRYKAIAGAIASAIEARELRPGQRLPTQRELANRLRVSVQTVSRAYAEAQRLHCISGEIGKGTFVRGTRSRAHAMQIGENLDHPALDFSNLAPAASDAHIEAIRHALHELAASADAPTLVADREATGTDYHRAAAAQWFARHGLAVSPEDLALTNNSAHGLWAAMATLTNTGDRIATECLVDSDVIMVASVLKLHLHGLAIDSEGIIPDAFEEACARERIKVLCTTPSYSNPTVAMMGQRRREVITEIAFRYDVTIIEIDIFAPLIADCPPRLRSLAPDRIWHVASLSHAIMAAMQTGYLVGPRDSMQRIISRLRAIGGGPSAWIGELAAGWMYDGTVDKLIERQRKKLQARHAVFDDIMSDQEYVSYPDSMHIWLSLPGQWRSSTFVRYAKTRGLLVTPPDPFIVGRRAEPHAVRLAIGNTMRDDDDFRRGVNELKNLLCDEPELVAWDF